MKVVYHCFGGTHTSVLTAAIHLGWLPARRIPSPDEIAHIPYFDDTPTESIGSPILMGQDEQGHQVYVLGLRGMDPILVPSIVDLLRVLNSYDQIYMVDTLRPLPFSGRAGGFISRRVGLVALGRPLILTAVRKAYPSFVRIALQTKEGLSGGWARGQVQP
ncbi:MAG: DUF3189 family protein [Firmicutes bacterium]|nr:DUF3189 family protein [Bacillota bacterium]